jgi:exopolysaccharide biosynthesis protein
LLLVVDGRQANSLGATYTDLIDIMLDFGAVNAANLDGGSSSYMVYENEIITTRASLYQPRRMATAILVSRVDDEQE